MKLTTAHQVLIVAAIILGAVFALRQLVLVSRGGTAGDAALAVASVCVAAGAGLYLRRFRRKLGSGKASGGSGS